MNGSDLVPGNGTSTAIGSSLQPAPLQPVRCRLDSLGRALDARRKAAGDRHDAVRLAARGKGASGYDAAASRKRLGGTATPVLAIIAPGASEAGWLEFDLAVGLLGLDGGFVDLDRAQAALGPEGAACHAARAAALCARRGVPLLVQTRQRPRTCPLRRICGARPPCTALWRRGLK